MVEVDKNRKEKELVARAAKETEMYIDLLTGLIMSLMQGYSSSSKTKEDQDKDLTGALECATKLADAITRIGVEVFNERYTFWHAEGVEKKEGNDA